MTNLYQAHREWATRPADQRFQSVDALHAAVLLRQQGSREKHVDVRDIRVEPAGSDLVAYGPNGGAVSFTHHSFGQLSRSAGAPAEYVASLPAPLAAECINHGLAHRSQKDHTAKALVAHTPAGLPTFRALTSRRYKRLWDAEVVEMAQQLTQGTEWQLPMGYRDGKWGADLVPSGAYASDRDVFLFMVDPSRPIEVHGDTLFRGFFLWNSEVGDKSFGMTLFLYRLVCGNNIVWGAEGITQVRRVHVGSIIRRSRQDINHTLRRYLDSSTAGDVAGVASAMTRNVAKDDQAAEEWLRGKGFTKAVATASVKAAKQEEGGAGTLWQLVQGLTAHARTLKHVDARTRLERDAGKLMALVN